MGTTKHLNLRREYKIQEYSGRKYKNPKTMAKSLANDDNWYDSTRAIEVSRIFASERLHEKLNHSGKYGRIFRLVSRPIVDWEVE